MTPHDAAFALRVRKADSDLLCLSNNLAAEHVPWDAVVFHAELAGEKLLKALLVSAGQPVPRTNDLIALATLAARLGYPMGEAEAEVAVLSRFGVGVRYPDLVYEPTDEDGREMTDAALRLRAFALALLEPRPFGDAGPGSAGNS